MGRLVVTNGATLVCNGCPGTPSILSVTGTLLTPVTMEQPVATIEDNEPGKNIVAFPDTCKFTHEHCKPKTPAPWAPGESSVLLPSLIPIISESARLSCTEGGTIEILYAGQSLFSVDMPPGFEAVYEDGVLIGYVVAAEGNKFYYYDAYGSFVDRFVDEALEADPILYDLALLAGGPLIKGGKWVGSRLLKLGVEKAVGQTLRGIPAYITARLRARAVPQNVRSKIPPGWKMEPSKGGVTFRNPKHPKQTIRVQPGNPKNPFPNSRNPYVKVTDKKGRTLMPDGTPTPRFSKIEHKKSYPKGNPQYPDAHQPVDTFRGQLGE